MPVYNNNFPRKAQKAAKLVTRQCSSASHSCVKHHENELMPCNVHPCRGDCTSSTQEQNKPQGFPSSNTWEWLQQAELPFAPHLQVE